jgi:hypothetical protein
VQEDNMTIERGNMIQQTLKPLSMLLIGLIIGAFVSMFMTNLNSDIEILYISQDELIDLEKNRIESAKNSKDLELFNGKVERAIGLIEDIAKSYHGSNSRVVFSRGPVNGDNVRSISQEVHTMLIQGLTEGNSDKERG